MASPARLEARLATSGTPAEVDFIGSGAAQGHVRAVGIEPCKEQDKLVVEARVRAARRPALRRFALEAAEETLDDRDTAALADSAPVLADAMTAAPALEAISGELHAGIGDQVFRGGAYLSDEPAQKVADLFGTRLPEKQREAQGGASDDRARRPATSKTASIAAAQRQPRHPEAERGGHNREIDMPDVVGLTSCDARGGGAVAAAQASALVLGGASGRPC